MALRDVHVFRHPSPSTPGLSTLDSPGALTPKLLSWIMNNLLATRLPSIFFHTY